MRKLIWPVAWYTQTWIVYNNTEGLWHCCGDKGCTGIPKNETFQAVAPSQWSALPSAATSTHLVTLTTSSLTSLASSPSSSTSLVSSPSLKPGQEIRKTGQGTNTGVKIGIGVASTVAGLAIMAAMFLFILWRKKVKSSFRAAAAKIPCHDLDNHTQQLNDSWRGVNGAPSTPPVVPPPGTISTQAELSEEDAGVRELPSQAELSEENAEIRELPAQGR